MFNDGSVKVPTPQTVEDLALGFTRSPTLSASR